MASRTGSTISQKLMYLALSVVTVLLGWSVSRYWLVSISFLNAYVHLIDVGIVVATGVAATVTLVKLVARPIAARAGPTHTNTMKLLVELLGIGLIVIALIILSGPSGDSFISALVGIGFFGIVLGLAAQEVLGNLFSGLMLLAARPFNINDRIALITWQYGKFAPSMSHGWLEPAYTGVVRGITLTYTRMLTDSSAILKIPNSIVTQSLIMNLSYGKQGVITTQFEAPKKLDPEELHTSLNLQLSKIEGFKGEEDSFDILEMSSTGYLVAVSYRVPKQSERQMKTFLLSTLRDVLTRVDAAK